MGKDVIAKNIEFLEQVYRMREMIAVKEEQLADLRSLTEKITASTFVRGGIKPYTNSEHGYEDALCKAMDLESQLVCDITEMFDIIRLVKHVIGRVEDKTLRVLLEMRYLNFKNWDEIGYSLDYCERHVYRLHAKAVMSIRVPRTIRDHRAKQSVRITASAV